MTLPPSSESGNVVDPQVLASRRARRAEVSEDAGLELRLFEAERRLGEVAAERDRLRARVTQVEGQLTVSRQREWAEQQERLEAQGETAAARELAGVQLAELRERLAAAEAELATVAAERDRARKALEDERLRVAAERERREALEREGLLLRSELARRDELTTAASSAVSAAREALAARDAEADARLAAQQRALVEGAAAEQAALAGRVEAERREFAGRVEAVERAVASVKDRLGAAARVLKERLEDERRARVAAESAADAARTRAAALERQQAAAGQRIAELETALAAAQARSEELSRELEQRIATEAQLRAALESLDAELTAVRADDQRMSRLTERVENVVAVATRLHDEASAEQTSLVELRAELETERAARWVAEAELETERRRGDTDRAARAAAEAELAASRIAQPVTNPATLASLREALSHLTTAPASPNPALDLDFAAAAARLRAEAPETEREPESEPLEEGFESESLAAELESVEEQLGAESPDLAEPVEVAEPVAVVEPEPVGFAAPSVVEPEPVEEEPEAEVVAFVVAPPVEPDDAAFVPTAAAPVPEPVEDEPVPVRPRVVASKPVRQPLPQRAPILKPSPWLRNALTALADSEPDIAELLLVALLPAQAGLTRNPITYELQVLGGTTHRVQVEHDLVRVSLPRGETPKAKVSGSLAALVPLVAGGAGRRLPDTTIENRRYLRRLLKARRQPVGLAELAAKAVSPSPGLLLTVLAKAVDPAWTQGRRLSIDVAAAGADRWRIHASGEGPLSILSAEDAPPADATLHTSAGLLPAVLAGTAQPSQASVEGSLRDVRTLLSWLDRAQRGGR
ncbi:hypothetical protein [Baekduia sp. Peel2402]|uniref:hypothetical protein n=1 Tax=Baekduia sp. Peel2402 TaxID=3458296 RepID=UPI00403EC8B2